jgi:signal transduction histidine kinase
MRFSTRSIHSVIFRSMMLLSINLLNVWHDFVLSMTFAKLLLSSIHWIFMIFFLSYDWRRHIRLIIRRFSMIILSLIKQSYKDLKFVQKINDRLFRLRIRLMIDLIIDSTSKSLIIAYNSIVSTLLMILLHLVKN